MKHAIRNRFDNSVLFECEIPEGLESGLHARYALEKAVEAGANLAGAYLAGANLAGANLARANLAGAYLAGANLARANLARAYLAGANLAGANLARANLAGANLDGAKWASNITISKTPIQVSGLTWPVTILDEHMQIGCQLHTLADWRAFDDRKIAEMAGRTALRFWGQNKAALLGMAEGAGRSFEPVVQQAVAA